MAYMATVPPSQSTSTISSFLGLGFGNQLYNVSSRDSNSYTLPVHVAN
jgi:hypothetical protein